MKQSLTHMQLIDDILLNHIVFLGFDTLFFIHSGIATLEIASIFFIVSALYYYFEKRYDYCAILFGIAILSKETSLFSLVALVLYHIIANRKKIIKPETKNFSASLTFIILLLVSTFSPLFSFNMIYRPVYFATPEDENNLRPTKIVFPWENFLYYYNYQRTFAKSYTVNQSDWYGTRWWGWILPTTFLLIHVPTFYEVNAITAKNATVPFVGHVYNVHSQRSLISTGNKTIEYRYNDVRYVGFGNPFVWSLFWLVPAVAFYFAIKRKSSEVGLFSIVWVLANYAPYIYIGEVLQRITFTFYFLNALIALPLLSAWILERVHISEDARVILFATHIAAVLLYFTYYFPMNVLRLP